MARHILVYSPHYFNGLLCRWSIAFDYIDRPLTTPSKTTLDAYKVGELTSAYITRLEKDWYYCVLNYVSGQYSYCG